MSDFLLGVPGKLKTLVDYLAANLSTTRAAKIDNLDAAISTRAAASTALSTATWTPARAAMLDDVAQNQTPIAASFHYQSTPALISSIDYLAYVAAIAGSKSDAWVSGTDYTLVNLTGPGVINFLAVVPPLTNTVEASITVIVDGVEVVPLLALGASDGTYYRVLAVVGCVVGTGGINPPIINFARLTYNTSLVVKVRINSSSTQTATVRINGFRS